MEDKEISRRDFVKKAFQLTTAGAVLAGMAGLEGVNPPEAEATCGDFIYFMKAAQDDPDLACSFINKVCGGNVTAGVLKDWFATQTKEKYNVSLMECELILEICKNIGKNATYVSAIQDISFAGCDTQSPKAY